jgi:hypothetical protein
MATSTVIQVLVEAKLVPKEGSADTTKVQSEEELEKMYKSKLDCCEQ